MARLGGDGIGTAGVGRGGRVNALIPEHIARGRLLHERIAAAHEPELNVLLLDPRVGATLWPTPEPPSVSELRRWLDSNSEHWRRHGWGLWLLRDRQTSAMVGRGGLQHTTVESEPAIEVGWAIVPERWGEGLATELAHTAVEIAFGVLELDRLVAFTLPHNIASRRVMEKSGFRYERDAIHVGLPHVLYARGPDGAVDASTPPP